MFNTTVMVPHITQMAEIKVDDTWAPDYYIVRVSLPGLKLKREFPRAIEYEYAVKQILQELEKLALALGFVTPE